LIEKDSKVDIDRVANKLSDEDLTFLYNWLKDKEK